MKKVRFCIIGFGNIAKTHMTAIKALPIIKQTGILPVLDTLVTRDPEKNRAQAEAIGFQYVTSSLEDALKNRSIDIVDVCTPNALHPDALRTSLDYGKTVYCEKPISHSAEVSAEICRSVRQPSIHQVALVYRYHPAVLRIKEALRQHLIGTVLQCNISYRRSGYLDAARPMSWRLDQGMSGGGAITDLGVHVLDLARFLLGEITDIHGEIETFVKKRPLTKGGSPEVDVHVDDWAVMHLKINGTIRGMAEVSRIAWGSESHRVEIVGTEGSISCDLEKDTHPTIYLLDGSRPKVPAPNAIGLLPDEKLTMGVFVDSHFGAIHHLLCRYAGMDDWDTAAPDFSDCLKAEELIVKVIGG